MRSFRLSVSRTIYHNPSSLVGLPPFRRRELPALTMESVEGPASTDDGKGIELFVVGIMGGDVAQAGLRAAARLGPERGNKGEG